MKRFIKALNALTFTVATTASLLVVAPSYAAPVLGQGTWQSTLQARDLDGNGIVDAFYDTDLDLTWLRNANVNGAKSFGDANLWAQNLSFGGFDDWRLPTMTDTGTRGCSRSFSGTDCGYNVQTSTSEMAHLLYVTLGNKPQFNTSGVEQSGFGLSNTANFQNMVSGNYWTDLSAPSMFGSIYVPPTIVIETVCTVRLGTTFCEPVPVSKPGGFISGLIPMAWSISTNSMEQDVDIQASLFYSMAVRKGGGAYFNDPNQIQLIPADNDPSPFPAPTLAVPEPETYAMMLAGLGLIGAIARRRKSKLPA